MNTSFYKYEELEELGLKKIGENVSISKRACFYGTKGIEIGNNVRIDDFCILSGNIVIGDWVHVAAYSAMFSGKYKIEVGNFSAISSRVAIYAESDDYTGISLSGAVRDDRFRHTQGGDVHLMKHVLIGTGCTVLPGVKVEEGVSVGAMSLVCHDLSEWSVYVGIPAKRIKNRSKGILHLEKEYCMACELL